jgi:uncharacterized protein (DUF427 family)
MTLARAHPARRTSNIETGESFEALNHRIEEKNMKAIWRGAVLAESDETIVVEGNHYFPPDSINQNYFRPSDHHTACPWKGEASYYDIVVGDDENRNAAWYYPEPKEAASHIRGRVAFWKGVMVE